MARPLAPVSSGALPTGLRHLDRRHRLLLVLLGATSFFVGYDQAIVALVLPRLRATYHLSQSEASLWLAVIFAGAIPALAVSRAADRLGRRRVLLVTVVGYAGATGLTAAAPTIEVFAACQFTAQGFLTAEVAIVWTLAAEALPADARGLGFGWLGMNAALGVGLGAVIWGGLLAPLGVSWRVLYLLGLPPLTLVAYLRRRLPESGRFEAVRRDHGLAERWRDILAPPHRRWLALVVATVFLLELINQASVFGLDFLQADRGASATAASLVLIGAGLPGIPLMVVAGALSDRYGRRLVGCTAVAVSLLGGLGFFWLPGGLPVLAPCLAIFLVGQLAAQPALSGYAAELFPTRFRGQAGAWAGLARAAGDSTSLAIGAAILAGRGGLPVTATFLATGPVLAVVLIAVAFPDTHRRELEELTN